MTAAAWRERLAQSRGLAAFDLACVFAVFVADHYHLIGCPRHHIYWFWLGVPWRCEGANGETMGSSCLSTGDVGS